MPNLLPPNATPEERALSDATARAADVPVIVREMWNPDTCPAEFLPWLAWAFSVDTWSDDWTDAQKRGAIKASVAVHEIKGTIGSLRAALDGLGYQIDLEEWFNQSPIGDPYTFKLNLIIDQVGIPNMSAFNKIIEVANDSKNLRSRLEGLDVHAHTSAGLWYGVSCLSGDIVSIQAEPVE